MFRINHSLTIGAFLLSALHGHNQTMTEINVSLREPSVSLGEPIVIVLLATNRGTAPETLDLGLDRDGVFRIAVVAPNGTVSQVRRPPFQGSEVIVRRSNAVVEPGSAYNQTLRLSEWYAFSQVGTYTLNVDLVSPSFPLQMNVFALAVTQRDQDRLREVCERLATAVARAPYSSSAREASLELRLISDPIAVPYLERVLAASPPFRSAAIEGLGKIGTLESAEILIRVRNGRDEEQKSLATAALRAIAHTTRDARVLDRLAIEGVESK